MNIYWVLFILLGLAQWELTIPADEGGGVYIFLD